MKTAAHGVCDGEDGAMNATRRRLAAACGRDRRMKDNSVEAVAARESAAEAINARIHERDGRRRVRLATLTVAAVGLAVGGWYGAAWAQPKGVRPPDEREARPEIRGDDMPGIWVLDFSYFKPRLIAVEIPGKGRRQITYMLYKVVNKTGQPRMFVPQFTLVGEDGEVYRDQVIPKALRAIQARENPIRTLETSVSVVGEIPPTPAEGLEIAKYGVAMWESVNPKLDHFSVFVEGLSNGYKLVDSKQQSGEPKVLRKTLEIKLFRPGDEFLQKEKEIQFVKHEWIYR